MVLMGVLCARFGRIDCRCSFRGTMCDAGVNGIGLNVHGPRHIIRAVMRDEGFLCNNQPSVTVPDEQHFLFQEQNAL